MLKQKFKTLSLRLLLAIVAIMALPDVANAATFSGGKKFYLTPGPWDVDGAQYAIYVFGDNGDGWSDIMKDNDKDGIYEGTAPNGTWNTLIFVRLSNTATKGDWGSKWNQTNNISYDGKNYYVITGWNEDNRSGYIYGNKVKFNYNSTDYEVTSGSNGEFSYTPSYLDGNASFYVKVNNTKSNYINYSPASETAISTDGTKSTWTNNATNKWTYTADPKKEYTIHTNVYNREVWVTYTDATITGVKLDLKGETVTSAPYTWTYTHSGETVTKTLTATNVYSNSYEETAATLDYEFVDGGIYTITYADGAITIDAQLPKQLTGVELTGLDGVSVGDATISGDVYTWSFTYSGKELVATVNVNETYDDGSVENATEAKNETFYNGSEYVITYNVETNELTITPTHKLVSVKCSLFENAASVAPYSWTYNHTNATERGVTLTFTENWTNGSTDYPLEGVNFAEGSAYSITYDAANHKGAVEETSKLALESIKIAGIADAELTNNEGVYSYEYTAAANGFTDFNFVTVYTNSEIEYSVNRYIGYTDVATATKAGVGYTEYAELDNKSFNYEFVQGAEYTIILDTANGLVKVIVALDSVKIDLAEAEDNGDGTWTYTHTGATAETTVTFTNVYTDASEEEAGSVTHTFVEGGVYTISYNNGSPTVTVVSEPKPVWSEVRIIGDISELGDWDGTNGTVITDDNADGIYEYNFTYNSSFHTGTYFAYCIKMSIGTDAHYLFALDENGKDLSGSAQSYQELDKNGTHSFTYPFVNTGVYNVILNTNTQTVSVQVISEPVEYAVYFYNDNDWGEVSAWVWTSGKNYTGGTWPGQKCTLIDSEKKLWKWTASEAIPEDAQIIFNNNNQGSKTGTFEWVNQAYYNPNGIVAGGDIEEDSTVQITGDEAGGWSSKKNMTQSQSQEGLYYYEFAQEEATKYFSFFINDAQYAHTNNMQLAVDVKYDLTADPETKNGRYYIAKQSQYIYTVYVDVVAKKFWVSAVLDASYKSGIPVYPLGVSTEGELAAYDFDANPVYYLCSPVLNANRISPEWQMEKEADGKFYIRGFAMRNTNARDNGDYLEEGKIKVVQYTSAEQEDGTKCVEITHNATGDSNPWSEGRLYDACYDPSTETLTLTKVVDRMPFISMVGYNFQQLENYTTPRNSTTSRGWQESWILYNENGEVVKDRNGKVLYSTMWPPKNPVYFNAVKDGESIELSSNNLTFTTDYAVQTGAAWKTEFEGDDAYTNLSLGSDTEYIRYKIDYMWILGATKIWTGWGGQSASWGSQWDNHINWGYGSDTGNESGTKIESQKSYTLAQNAGNFMVAEPTYYQTVEFFYNVSNPSSSVFYTTLAHGNPSIRAKATADYHGNYDIEVKGADGLAITAYTVTRYNAVTGEVDTANDDNGAVKSETGDWKAETFNNETWVDDKELANGKYYYVLDITIDGKEVTVQSNPFTIYRPADHQTEVKVMQLLELAESVNGAKYITVPVTSEGQLDETADLWYVEVDANDAVKAVKAVSDLDAARQMIKSEMTAYEWTMKALITSEKPASWTTEMEDTAADTMQDGDVTNWNLTVNGTEVIKVAPNDNDNMLYIYNHGVPSTNSYKATMDYTYKLDGVAGTKSTLGKETALTLEVPQAVAALNELVVIREEDATITGNVIPQNGGDEMLQLSEATFTNPFHQPMDNDEGKAQTEIEETNIESASVHEQVNVTFNFTMPSISEDVFNKCVVAYMPKLTAYKDGAIVQQKYLSLVKDIKFGDAEKAITVTGIDPTWDKITLSIATQYYDKEDMSSFVEGRFGTAPVMEKEVSFEAGETLSITGEVWQYERMARKQQEGFHYEGTGKFDLGVSKVTVQFSEGNAIVGGTEVTAPAYYNLGVNHNSNSFASPYVFDGKGHDLGVLWEELETQPSGSVTLEVRPVYFFETISEMELVNGTGLELFDPAATPATASTVDNGQYVALYGKTNSVEIKNIQTSVEDAVMSGAVVKAGQGYIEVIGAETSAVYSVSGAMVGNDESRYDVVPGVYVVIADGKAVKVVVR